MITVTRMAVGVDTNARSLVAIASATAGRATGKRAGIWVRRVATIALAYPLPNMITLDNYKHTIPFAY